MTNTYIVKRPFGGHAKGDEVTLNPRQAQFMVTSGQVAPKKAARPAPKKAAKAGGAA